MVLVAFDHQESLVLVEPDLGGHQEYFGEEVLLGQQLFVVGLLQLRTFISYHIENYN